MIVDTFENAARYYMLHPAMEMMLDFLENTTIEDFKEGKTELSGSDVFVNGINKPTKPEEEAIWESHEKYIDVHYLLEGKEIIKFAEEDEMTGDVPYDEEKDRTLFKGSNGYRVHFPKGGFVIFFPGEIHKAMVADGIPTTVKKLVGKIAVD